MAESTATAVGSRPIQRADRLTVWLLAMAAFLVVLGLLSLQQRDRASTTARVAARVIVQRRIYQTTVVERLITSSAGSGASSAGSGPATVVQSVSGSAPVAAAVPTAPVTRTS